MEKACIMGSNMTILCYRREGEAKMKTTRKSMKHRLAALGLAAALVFTGVAVTDMGGVQAAQTTADTQTVQSEDGVYRVSGSSRYKTSLAVAEQIRAEMGVDQFDKVILATGSNFADALSGSYLSYVENAPILLIDDNSANEVRSYIRTYLKTGGMVYVLGGENAVPYYMTNGLAPKFEVVRLAGKNRYETNIEILEEAGVDSSMSSVEMLVCTGTSYADSLSASAAKRPILLVGSQLTALQKEYLSTLKNDKYYVLGGVNAVASSVKAEVSKYGTTIRIAGDNRYDTSEKIAKQFVTSPEAVVVAYGQDFPDGLCGGLLAAINDAPVILTSQDRESSITTVTTYVSEKNITDGYVLGGTKRFSDATIAKMFGISASDIKTTTWVSTDN